jgi:5'-nucleotidase
MTAQAASRPRILLTNDDGVAAPGLLALKQALGTVARVDVVAPERNWSAAGHTRTMHKPLRVRRVALADGSEALATNGTPSDCVALALLGLLEREPDLVVSGINAGANVGSDITYSGTVAAAMEAVIAGIPAIAVSVDALEITHLTVAAAFVARLALLVLHQATDEPLLLNVNVPDLPRTELRGVQITRLGHRIYRDALVERSDPRGRTYYWIGGEPPLGVPEEGTDIGALEAGHISITPIVMDLTDYRNLPALRAWQITLEDAAEGAQRGRVDDPAPPQTGPNSEQIRP